jgi:hypothetical protein
MKELDRRQLEFACDLDELSRKIAACGSDDELLRRIDKIIKDTTGNVRPYLNRMVKDVERLLEGSFIRTPSSNVLDDLIEGLEKDMRKFVDEVRALQKWTQSHPPHSSSNNSH